MFQILACIFLIAISVAVPDFGDLHMMSWIGRFDLSTCNGDLYVIFVIVSL